MSRALSTKTPADFDRAATLAVAWSRACCRLVDVMLACPLLMVAMADAATLADDELSINPDAVVILRCCRAWHDQADAINAAGIEDGLIGDSLARYRSDWLVRLLSSELKRAGLWHDAPEISRPPDRWSAKRLAGVIAKGNVAPYPGEPAAAELVAQARVIAAAVAALQKGAA